MSITLSCPPANGRTTSPRFDRAGRKFDVKALFNGSEAGLRKMSAERGAGQQRAFLLHQQLIIDIYG